jgi:hypothetical protein
MSESTSTSLEEQDALEGAGRGRVPRGSGAILFPELVWAHYIWQHETGKGPRRGSQAHLASPDHDRPESGDERASEKEYRQKLRAFQDAEGEILDAYWCWNEASAVALTASRPRRLTFRRRHRQMHLHRATDWATIGTPAIADLLHRLDSLAIRASEILTPTPKRIAMERIFAEQSYLLSSVETTDRKPTDSQLRAVIAKEGRALTEIESYYDRAAQNAGRIYYFFGMMAGLTTLAALAALVVIPLVLYTDLELVELRDYLSSYSAGALGAVVSVMSRMRQDVRSPQAFHVDYEVGRSPLWFLGGVRPFLGAIFGTATYFALRSGLIRLTPEGRETEFYFYALLAFLSGFSERFAHVILGQAESGATSINTGAQRSGDASLSQLGDNLRQPRGVDNEPELSVDDEDGRSRQADD